MLTCAYGGVPQPSVLWYTLTGDTRTNIRVNNPEYIVGSTLMETVLIIRIVDDEDDVIYGCEATNTVDGTVVMEKIELDIDICCKQLSLSTYVAMYVITSFSIP